MKNLKSELFEKNIVSSDQLLMIIGGGPRGEDGVETECGPAYDGDVQYSDHCSNSGEMTYSPC